MSLCGLQFIRLETVHGGASLDSQHAASRRGSSDGNEPKRRAFWNTLGTTPDTHQDSETQKSRSAHGSYQDQRHKTRSLTGATRVAQEHRTTNTQTLCYSTQIRAFANPATSSLGISAYGQLSRTAAWRELSIVSGSQPAIVMTVFRQTLYFPNRGEAFPRA